MRNTTISDIYLGLCFLSQQQQEKSGMRLYFIKSYDFESSNKALNNQMLSNPASIKLTLLKDLCLE